MPTIAASTISRQDVFDSAAAPREAKAAPRLDSSTSGIKRRACELFLQGKSIDEVCQAVSRARSTVSEYLVTPSPATASPIRPPGWTTTLFTRIRAAAKQHGIERLKPLFEALGDEISYDEIRIALACLRNAPPEV